MSRRKRQPPEDEDAIDDDYRRRLLSPHVFGTFILPTNIRVREFSDAAFQSHRENKPDYEDRADRK